MSYLIYNSSELRNLDKNIIIKLNDIYHKSFENDQEQQTVWDFNKHIDMTYTTDSNIIEKSYFFIFFDKIYDSDTIIGIINYTINQNLINILFLCVDSQYQNKRYAHKMLDMLIDSLYNYNYKSISLEVWDWNQQAIKSYTKYGFDYTKSYYDSPTHRNVHIYEYIIKNKDKNKYDMIKV